MTTSAGAALSRGRLAASARLVVRLIGFLLLLGVLTAPLGLLAPMLAGRLPDAVLRVLGDGVLALALVAATAVFARWVDRRPVSDFALTYGRLARDLALGAALGLGMTAAVAATLLAGGQARVGDSFAVTAWGALGFAALATLVNCFVQEFLLRGYLLMALARTWGGAAAVVVTSLLFAAIHPPVWAATPQAWLLAADIFGAGLLLGGAVVWLAWRGRTSALRATAKMQAARAE